MKKKIIIGLICLSMILMVGCMSAEQLREYELKRAIRLNKIFDANPDWSWTIRDNIMNEKISLGMTKEQVLLSWGHPCGGFNSCINTSIGVWGVHEQWVYHSPYGPYLYFENGTLTSWQK